MGEYGLDTNFNNCCGGSPFSAFNEGENSAENVELQKNTATVIGGEKKPVSMGKLGLLLIVGSVVFLLFGGKTKKA